MLRRLIMLVTAAARCGGVPPWPNAVPAGLRIGLEPQAILTLSNSFRFRGLRPQGGGRDLDLPARAYEDIERRPSRPTASPTQNARTFPSPARTGILDSRASASTRRSS